MEKHLPQGVSLSDCNAEYVTCLNHIYPLHVNKGPCCLLKLTPDLENSNLFTYKKVAERST